MISNRLRFGVVLTLALVFPGLSNASGDSENLPSKESVTAPSLKTPDIGGAGTLDYSVDIAVPSFHGVEPICVRT